MSKVDDIEFLLKNGLISSNDCHAILHKKIEEIITLPKLYYTHFSYPEIAKYSNVSEPWEYQATPELPKRKGVNYISSIDELRENDLILTVDYGNNESVERVKCVDMGIWTEGMVDGEEIFETKEEFAEYRFVILLNR